MNADAAFRAGSRTTIINHDFTLLWIGESVSALGSQIAYIAVPLTAVITLDASPAQLGAIFAAQFFPAPVFALVGGVLSDRISRRAVLITTNLARGVVMGIVPILAILDALSFAALLAAAFAIGTLTVFFDVAYLAYLPTLVTREKLLQGNSYLQMSQSVAQTAGRGLGTALVQLFTAPLALVVDATSYLFSAALLLKIRRSEEKAVAAQPLGSSRLARAIADIRLGFAALMRDRLLRFLTLEAGIFNLLIQAFVTVLLIYVARDLGLSAAYIGAIFTMGGVGAVAGSVSARRAASSLGIELSLLGSIVLRYGGLAIMPFVGGSTTLATVALALLFLSVSFGLAVTNVLGVTVRQSRIDDALLGRANGSFRFVAFLGMPLGAIGAGLIASNIGVRPALYITSELGLLVLPWAAVFLRGRSHELAQGPIGPAPLTRS